MTWWSCATLRERAPKRASLYFWLWLTFASRIRIRASAAELLARYATIGETSFGKACAMRCVATILVTLAVYAGAAEPREDLKPLAQHRQQHRRTLDGRLCAAAFVFDRQTHTGCSDGSNPAGEHGREWCYVDAQVAHASGAIWCALFGACVFMVATRAVIGWWSW